MLSPQVYIYKPAVCVYIYIYTHTHIHTYPAVCIYMLSSQVYIYKPAVYIYIFMLSSQDHKLFLKNTNIVELITDMIISILQNEDGIYNSPTT